MKTCCVVSADGSRARIMLIKDVLPEEAGPELKEVETLYNLENRMSDCEVWTDKNNSNRAADGAVHGYDDHRVRHRHACNSHFSRRIVNRVLALASQQDAGLILILAESKMLGLIRKAWAKRSPCGFVLKDDDKNVSGLAPYELHHYLAREGLLPERHKPQGWRGRAAS
jgi:hypothetical protein